MITRVEESGVEEDAEVAYASPATAAFAPSYHHRDSPRYAMLSSTIYPTSFCRKKKENRIRSSYYINQKGREVETENGYFLVVFKNVSKS